MTSCIACTCNWEGAVYNVKSIGKLNQFLFRMMAANLGVEDVVESSLEAERNFVSSSWNISSGVQVMQVFSLINTSIHKDQVNLLRLLENDQEMTPNIVTDGANTKLACGIKNDKLNLIEVEQKQAHPKHFHDELSAMQHRNDLACLSFKESSQQTNHCEQDVAADIIQDHEKSQYDEDVSLLSGFPRLINQMKSPDQVQDRLQEDVSFKSGIFMQPKHQVITNTSGLSMLENHFGAMKDIQIQTADKNNKFTDSSTKLLGCRVSEMPQRKSLRLLERRVDPNKKKYVRHEIPSTKTLENTTTKCNTPSVKNKGCSVSEMPQRKSLRLLERRMDPTKKKYDRHEIPSTKTLENTTTMCNTPSVKNKEKRNGKGETKLHFAARSGHADVVKKFILQQWDVDVEDFAGWTPLHEACLYNHLKIAKYLLDAGAKVNCLGFNKMTPLHDAVIHGHTKVVKLLLDYGADPNIQNVEGNNCLDVAKDLEVTHLLLPYTRNGANKNKDTSTNSKSEVIQREKVNDCANNSTSKPSTDNYKQPSAWSKTKVNCIELPFMFHPHIYNTNSNSSSNLPAEPIKQTGTEVLASYFNSVGAGSVGPVPSQSSEIEKQTFTTAEERADTTVGPKNYQDAPTIASQSIEAPPGNVSALPSHIGLVPSQSSENEKQMLTNVGIRADTTVGHKSYQDTPLTTAPMIASQSFEAPPGNGSALQNPTIKTTKMSVLHKRTKKQKYSKQCILRKLIIEGKIQPGNNVLCFSIKGVNHNSNLLPSGFISTSSGISFPTLSKWIAWIKGVNWLMQETTALKRVFCNGKRLYDITRGSMKKGRKRFACVSSVKNVNSTMGTPSQMTTSMANVASTLTLVSCSVTPITVTAPLTSRGHVSPAISAQQNFDFSKKFITSSHAANTSGTVAFTPEASGGHNLNLSNYEATRKCYTMTIEMPTKFLRVKNEELLIHKFHEMFDSIHVGTVVHREEVAAHSVSSWERQFWSSGRMECDAIFLQ
uniref:Uncharacterized protein n=1 Tax=Eptatretus burgeri TaxID=7764 RepID=A0A8C4N8T6_EPTBU